MHLFQVGAGSGGIVVLDLLARDPRVSRVTLVEPDVYKAHNVYRHLFPPAAVGQRKADLAAEWVRERRPDVVVEAVVADLTDAARQADFRRAAAACDVGVCAVDNEPAKYAFDALMRAAGKPWTLGEVLSGGIGGWVHRFSPGGACYGCAAAHLKRNVTEEAPPPAPDYSAPGGPVAETTVPASRASIAVIAGLHAAVTLDLLARAALPAPATPPPAPPPEGEGGTPREPGGESVGHEPGVRLLPSSSPPSFLGKGAGGFGGSGLPPATPSQEGGATRVPTEPPASPVREGGTGGVDSSGFTSLLFTLAAVPGVFDVAYRPYRFAIPKAAGCLVCAAGPAPAGEDLDVALDQALARLGDN